MRAHFHHGMTRRGWGLSPPVAGERVCDELGRGSNGKPQAVRVFRKALGQPAQQLSRSTTAPRTPRAMATAQKQAHPSRRTSTRHEPGTSPRVKLVLVALLAAVSSMACVKYQSHTQSLKNLPAAATAAQHLAQPAAGPSSSSAFRCDGRTHCSQMTSCREAKFFPDHCPGVQMDGNNDGVPCEQQWCTSPLAQ